MKSRFHVIGLMLVLVFAAASCGNKSEGTIDSSDVTNNATADGNGSTNGPAITLKKLEHDFGEVNAGEKLEYNFKFSNTGNKDLLITNASSTCGCTVPSYPKEAIAPGESGVITVAFTRSSPGFAEKHVTISTNCEKRDVKLTVKANVVEPK